MNDHHAGPHEAASDPGDRHTPHPLQTEQVQPEQVQPEQGSDAPGGNGAVESAERAQILGVALGPALTAACGEHLGEIEWFRSPWQRSGSATGRSVWRENGSERRVVVKVPVGYREWFWTTRINERSAEAGEPCPVPRVMAHGLELDGYDMAWLVEERVDGRPGSARMTPDDVDRMMDAAARFHAIAPVATPIPDGKDGSGRGPDGPIRRDWHKLLAAARRGAEDNPIADQDRWLRAIDALAGDLARFTEPWEARPIDTWCHGDLHPGNLIRREAAADHAADCMLLDLALVHAGHWIEDALALERLYWGREHLLGGIDPVERLGSARRRHGLGSDDPGGQLARARRALMAATSPAALSRFSDPVYLDAALGVLERSVSA